MVKFENFLEGFALSLLTLLFSILFVSAILFFADINISRANFVCAFILSWGILFFLNKRPYKSLLQLILCTIFILASYWQASHFTDLSYDGNSYHIPAVQYLILGWNPFDINHAFSVNHDWIKYYTKGSWIIEASLVHGFSPILAWGAKSLNYITSVCATILLYLSFVKLNISKNKPLIGFLAFLCVFNFVNIGQMQCFMVDGLLSSCMIILISCIILYVKEKSIKSLFFVYAALSLLISIKLSSVAYAFFIIIASIPFIFKKHRIKYLITCGLSTIFSVLIICFNPFCTNFYKHHNPVYPIGAKDAAIISDAHIPPKFRGNNRIKKFLLTTYARTNCDKEVILKNPLSIQSKEAWHIYCDTRVCGFGAFWGLIFTLSILSLIFLCREKDFKYLLYIIAILFASILSNPECWWARFIPQAWFLPVIVSAYSIMKKKEYIGVLLILTMSANLCFYYFVQYL